ncbi:MAG: hypothetical protein AAFU79_18950, partial [Myxococcota bacterium]
MIMSPTDPRDDRFLIFLEEADGVPVAPVSLTDRIDRLTGTARALAEAVERSGRPEDVSSWSLSLAAWALSPDPIALRPWTLTALRALRRDRVRARNVAGGIVDWVLGQVRTHTSELCTSWQALHDSGLGYPIDADARIRHPAQASAEVTVWSYALLRAVIER